MSSEASLDMLEDWEEWNPESGTSFFVHALAGSCAGAAEHCAMFPFDTIKTHLQAESVSQKSAESIIHTIIRTEGPLRLWRGVSTMLTGCVPAHAAYFAIYENSKVVLGVDQPGHHPVAAAATGMLSTIAHDSIMTPMDVIKQRLQLGFHTGIIDCVKSITRTEGIAALLISFPTTLIMNIPYAGIMVSTNESLKTFLNPTNEYNVPAFIVSGAIAGATAAALTNPLDVVKTRLQTQNILMQRSGISSGRNVTNGGTPSFRGIGTLGGSMFGPALNPGMSFAAYSKGCRYKYSDRAFNKGAPSATQTREVYSMVLRNKSNNTKYSGLVDAMTKIYAEEGLKGFARGIKPRLMVHAPSVAISWTTYETAKTLFSQKF